MLRAAEDKQHTVPCSCSLPTVTPSMPLSLVSDQAAKQLPVALYKGRVSASGYCTSWEETLSTTFI